MKMKNAILVPVFLSALLVSPAGGEERKPALALSPCELKGVPGAARCGTLTVFEDRAAKRGRTIGLKFVVLPATKPPAAPDPLFVLAGGPGEAATEEAPGLAVAFAAIRERRDIVLVDQQCGSHPSVDLFDPPWQLLGDFLPSSGPPVQARLEKTRISTYTTSIAMDDLDDVRGARLRADQLWGSTE
jgi:pimeloyl-ACP methyl ester carboxylesterase